jgi:SAM-dependent methyltransferase
VGRIASAAWAGFYDQVGTSFAVSVAPRIRAFYETTPVGTSNRNLLDVCCGTGQLARHFLDNGYRVTGIDLSEEMLRLARLNVGEHLDAGRARFILADASDFAVERKFGLATSTFDALNLLPGLDATRLPSLRARVSRRRRRLPLRPHDPPRLHSRGLLVFIEQPLMCAMVASSLASPDREPERASGTRRGSRALRGRIEFQDHGPFVAVGVDRRLPL